MKYVQIILDDFTDKSLLFQNTELYDFGLYTSYIHYDHYYYDWFVNSSMPVDYGDFDQTIVETSSKNYFNVGEFFDLRPYDSGIVGPTWSGFDVFSGIYRYEEYTGFLKTEEKHIIYSS